MLTSFLLLLAFLVPDARTQDSDATRRAWIADLQTGSAAARRAARDKLVAEGVAAIPCLLPLLAHDTHDVRRTAAGVLGDIGEPAVPALVEVLERGSEPVRKAAAMALRRIGNPAVGPLLEVIRRRDRAAVRWATWALRPQAATVVPVLVDALRQSPPNADLRAAAISGLAQIGPASVPALRPLLRDRRAHVRQAAADTLAELGAPAAPAIPDLIVMVGDANASVALAAANALVAIGPAAVDALVVLLDGHDGDPRCRRAAVALLRIGSPAMDALFRCVRGSEPASSRAHAILQEIGAQPGAPSGGDRKRAPPGNSAAHDLFQFTRPPGVWRD
jgi:HEAT repeat protein